MSSDTRAIDPVRYQERMRAETVVVRRACRGMILVALSGRETAVAPKAGLD
jgi:hypothetical protein